MSHIFHQKNYSGFNFEVAKRWAPIHYQDIDDDNHRADYISAVDFDGDWRTIGNWDNMNRYPLIPVVYFSVAETYTHWFVIYMFYHPRDWHDDRFGGGKHENDAEGLLTIIKKPYGIWRYYYPTGFYRGMVTIAHDDFWSYSNVLSSNREDIDGRVIFTGLRAGSTTVLHPSTYQESEGHGCYAWNGRQFPGGDGLRYYPWHWAKEPRGYGKIGKVDAPYVLVDIFENGGLWDRRCASINEPFTTARRFAGRKHDDDKASPPWNWDDKDDGSDLQAGALAYNPSYLCSRYFSGEYFSPYYVNNRYFNLSCRRNQSELVKLLSDGDNEAKYSAALDLFQSNNTVAIDQVVDAVVEQNYSWEAIAALSQNATKSKKILEKASHRILKHFKTYKKSGRLKLGRKEYVTDSRQLAPLVYLMGELKNPAFTTPLVEIYSSRSNTFLQHIAGEALAKHDVKYLKESRDLSNALQNGINSFNRDVRGASAALFGKLSSQKNIEPIIPLLSDDFPNVRIKAIEAMNGSQSFDTLGILKNLLDDSQWDVKEAAAKTLINNFRFEGLDYVVNKFKEEASCVYELLSSNKNNITVNFSECQQTVEESGRMRMMETISDSMFKYKPDLELRLSQITSEKQIPEEQVREISDITTSE